MTGPTGPQGAAGVFTGDFAVIYMASVAANTNNAVAASTTVPFTTITRSPPASHISLTTNTTVGSTAWTGAVGGVGIGIATTGNYQVTFGIMPVISTAVSTGSFILLLSTDSTANVEQQTLEYQNGVNAQVMYSLTTIVKVTQTGSTLFVYNNTGSSVNLNGVSAKSTGGPAAYLTMFSLE